MMHGMSGHEVAGKMTALSYDMRTSTFMEVVVLSCTALSEGMIQ
jgi:hypothetical protein